MDLYKELEQNGYAVCDVENLHLFQKLTNSFVDSINIPGIKKKILKRLEVL